MALGLEWLDEQCYAKMYRMLDIGGQGAIRFHALDSEEPNQAAVSLRPALPPACSRMQI